MKTRLLVISVLALALTPVCMAAEDPLAGTWREKSQLTLASVPGGISFQEDQNKPDIAHFDKDSQFSNGPTIHLVRIDDHTITKTETRSGTEDLKLIRKETITSSSDGKRLTLISENNLSEGKSSILYERVGPAQSGDAYYGSWRKVSPLETIAFKIDGETINFTTFGREFTAKIDGEPATGGTLRPNASVQVKRVDAQTIDIIRKFGMSPAVGLGITTRYQVKGHMLAETFLSTGQTSQYERVNSEVSGARDYVSELGSPDKQGIYTVRQPGATDLYFKKEGNRYTWSPDQQNWMPTNTFTVSGGSYKGRSPASANVEIINGLEVLSGGTASRQPSSDLNQPGGEANLQIFLAARRASLPFIGTWKLNVTKSQAGIFPKWKGGTVKVGAEEGGQKYVADYDYEQASSLHTEYTAKYDGRDYPTVGSSYFDTVSIKRPDANTLEFLWKKDGKETARWQWMISGDGNTSVITMKTIYQESVINQLMVLDKQ